MAADATISSSDDRLGLQPRIAVAFSGDATSAGGSPGRRGPMAKGTDRPVARSTAATTSSTVLPAPAPRFIAVVSPPARK